uniref:NADH-ubiquinone oxidoreductase chain 1 n=1 Tax=Syrbatus sp. 1 RRMO-2024a TaxID=3154167 RepID=A0AAU7LMD5_9COLE
MFMSIVILLIMIMISVGYIILFERKLLSSIQIRKGPNKVGFNGIIQPFSDVLKLIMKENMFLYISNYNIYYICPVMNLVMSMFMWMNFSMLSLMLDFEFSCFFFFCCSSLSIYSIMIAGWSSNSIYSMLGSIRMIAQLISYEVSLFMIMLSYFLMISNLSLLYFQKYQNYLWLIYLYLPLSLMLLILGLAETNRIPFDFAESESELVSGFNVEYSSGGFILIFMSEYMSIMYMGMFFSMIFMGGNFNQWSFSLKIILFLFMWIWIRGCFSRFRYDKLMNLAWKSFLLMSMNYLLFYLGLMMLMKVNFI